MSVFMNCLFYGVVFMFYDLKTSVLTILMALQVFNRQN